MKNRALILIFLTIVIVLNSCSKKQDTMNTQKHYDSVVQELPLVTKEDSDISKEDITYDKDIILEKGKKDLNTIFGEMENAEYSIYDNRYSVIISRHPPRKVGNNVLIYGGSEYVEIGKITKVILSSGVME